MRGARQRQAGVFDKLMTIESATRTPGTMGGASISWASAGTAWCAIRPRSSRDGQFQERYGVVITHDVVSRYHTALVAGNRLVLGSRVFMIRGVLNDNEGNGFVTCECTEEAL